MNRLISQFLGWFGYGGALGENTGKQVTGPSGSLVAGTTAVAPDGALQLSTVWACVDLLANSIASLPLFVYTKTINGHRQLARDTLLWGLLHDSPNNRMTPMEFWVATITEFHAHSVNDDVDYPLYGSAWNFAWQVNAALNSVTDLRVDMTVDDPLAAWGNALLECVIKRLKPAHTEVLFSYS